MSDEHISQRLIMETIAPLLLIESSSNLQITRTAIPSRMSLSSGQIRLFTSELLATECRKTLLLILSGAPEFRPDQTFDFGVTCPLVLKTSMFDLVQF